MLKSRYAGESKISAEDAIRKATAFLGEKGYTKIKESYYSTVDGVCPKKYQIEIVKFMKLCRRRF